MDEIMDIKDFKNLPDLDLNVGSFVPEYLALWNKLNIEKVDQFSQLDFFILLIDSSASMMYPSIAKFNQPLLKRIQEKPKDQTLNLTREENDIIRKAQTDILNIISKEHKNILKSIRDSEQCSCRRLLITQASFNKEIRLYNAFDVLDCESNDHINIIKQDNFVCTSSTALYRTIYEMLRPVYNFAIWCFNHPQNKISHRIRLGIITDGKDNLSTNLDKEKLIQLIDNITLGKKIDFYSILVGLTSNLFPDIEAEKIRKELKINSYINVEHNDQRAIRKAFNYASRNPVDFDEIFNDF